MFGGSDFWVFLTGDQTLNALVWRLQLFWLPFALLYVLQCAREGQREGLLVWFEIFLTCENAKIGWGSVRTIESN